jgi:hypothetical protein
MYMMLVRWYRKLPAATELQYVSGQKLQFCVCSQDAQKSSKNFLDQLNICCVNQAE